MHDHSGEHAAYCWTVATVPMLKSMPATDCPYCKAFDAGYRAGYANGRGEDNDSFSITVQGGAA